MSLIASSLLYRLGQVFGLLHLWAAYNWAMTLSEDLDTTGVIWKNPRT